MCELYEEKSHRIPCEVGKSVFDVIFYGANPSHNNDLGEMAECSVCAKHDLENGMKFRRRLLPVKDLVHLDNGKKVCQECLVE